MSPEVDSYGLGPGMLACRHLAYEIIGTVIFKWLSFSIIL